MLMILWDPVPNRLVGPDDTDLVKFALTATYTSTKLTSENESCCRNDVEYDQKTSRT